MRQRIRELNRFQKAILILLAVIAVLFSVVYIREKSRSGYVYNNTILIRNEENGNKVYSGKISGKEALFTVTPDHTVTFRYGEKDYGVYTAEEDMNLIPAAFKSNPEAKGYTVYRDGTAVFEGCMVWQNGQYRFYTKDGNPARGDLVITYYSEGVERDQYGNVVDRMEPTAFNVLELVEGPDLKHRGIFIGWFGGTLICILTALSILFADELFHLKMAFRIKDAFHAEPSELELLGRYGAWTVLPIVAVVMYVLGLQV